MKRISNRSWKVPDEERVNKIKEWLLTNGGIEKQTKTQYEVWRIKFSDATFTYYTSGKLSVTDTNNESVLKAHNYILSITGSQFITSNKKFLIGFDEAGKGEVLGHIFLVGVIIPNDLYTEIEREIGVANTKIKHEVRYWADIFRKIESYQTRGLKFLIEKIPPCQVDKYNINRLFDITYERILRLLIREVDIQNTRIVLDDYGLGFNLDTYLESLKQAGAEVIKINKADDTYLESRVASLIAKHEQQREIEAISMNEEFHIHGATIGSGNISDPRTREWLRAWYQSGKDWPSFVKRSYLYFYQNEE
ncbi:MAG: hypothetical protein QXK74_06170 [Candidatus Nitrosocaldaceae archaeon]